MSKHDELESLIELENKRLEIAKKKAQMKVLEEKIKLEKVIERGDLKVADKWGMIFVGASGLVALLGTLLHKLFG